MSEDVRGGAMRAFDFFFLSLGCRFSHFLVKPLRSGLVGVTSGRQAGGIPRQSIFELLLSSW